MFSHTSGLADLGRLGDALAIALGIGRDLDLLAELADVHSLPAGDALHLGEELGGRPGRVHVGGDVRVVDGALLEDADAVVVAAHAVVRVVERFRDVLVGEDADVGL